MQPDLGQHLGNKEYLYELNRFREEFFASTFKYLKMKDYDMHCHVLP